MRSFLLYKNDVFSAKKQLFSKKTSAKIKHYFYYKQKIKLPYILNL